MKSIAEQLPPEIARQIHPDRRKNEEAYWALRDQLLDQYRGQWIGFANGMVVASGTSPVSVFHAVESAAATIGTDWGGLSRFKWKLSERMERELRSPMRACRWEAYRARRDFRSVFALFLPHWATFEKPGRYTITIRRKLELYLADVALSIDGKTETVESSAKTTVLIVPHDAVKFGKIIADVGKAMLGVFRGLAELPGRNSQSPQFVQDSRNHCYELSPDTAST